MGKRAVVLSGGGAKGCFQVGALKALTETKKYDCAFGVSTGALSAVMLAQEGGRSVKTLEDLYLGIKSAKDILKKRWWWCRALFKDSLYDNTPLRELLTENLDFIALGTSSCSVKVGAVDLVSGRYTEYTYDKSVPPPLFIDWVMASTSIPVAFKPVHTPTYEDGNVYLVDGGVRNIAPLSSAIKDGATDIDVIVCSPLDVQVVEYKESTAFVAERALDLLLNEVLREDIRRAKVINEMIDEAKVAGTETKMIRKLRRVKINMYAPSEPVCGTLEFNPAKLRAGIQQGYWSVHNKGVR